MFARYIDDTYAPVVRKNLDRLIWGRLFSNACYRFAPPFIAVIARGLDVSVAQMGVALMIGEFAGLGSPILGRIVDKGNRVVSMTIGMIGITLAVVGAATSTTLVQFAISMFVMSGAKVARLLKYDERYKEIPFILLGSDNALSKINKEEYNIEKVLPKPFRLGDLKDAIETLLG